MALTQVNVPDLGGIDEVEVIEICVQVGDHLEHEEALIVLESDKATMEVPAPFSGTVNEILVAVGDKVGTGTHVANMQTQAEDSSPSKKTQSPGEKADEPVTKAVEESEQPAPVSAAADNSSSQEIDVTVPDLGGVDAVEIIELSAAPGDELAVEESLMVLESDKATMEIPAPHAGKLISFNVKVGDKVSQGDVVAKMLVAQATENKSQPASASSPTQSKQEKAPEKSDSIKPATTQVASNSDENGQVHAGPAVRKLARELGVDLSQVRGSGPRDRIQKNDLHDFVKQRVNNPVSSPLSVKGSDEDFSKYGEISETPLTKIKQVTARNMVASWTTIPQVTQFDEADITELEIYRKQSMSALLPEGVKVSPLSVYRKSLCESTKSISRIQFFPWSKCRYLNP